MYILKEDRHVRIAVVLIAGMMVILVLAYALNKIIGTDILLWFTTLVTILSSASCAVLCGILWHHFRKGEVLKKIWGCLWIGLMLWAAAEIVYGVYDIFLVEDTPYPSLADAFFVPGFIPIFLALFFRYTSLRVTPPRRLMWISVAVFGLVGILWLIFFVLGPIIQEPEAGDTIKQILNIVYPLGDLLVVMGALLSMLALVGGELSLPWGAIALACLLLAFSDSLYSYATWKDIYFPEGGINFITALCDTSYITGYLVMALGLYVQARLQRIL